MCVRSNQRIEYIRMYIEQLHLYWTVPKIMYFFVENGQEWVYKMLVKVWERENNNNKCLYVLMMMMMMMMASSRQVAIKIQNGRKKLLDLQDQKEREKKNWSTFFSKDDRIWSLSCHCCCYYYYDYLEQWSTKRIDQSFLFYFCLLACWIFFFEYFQIFIFFRWRAPSS